MANESPMLKSGRFWSKDGASGKVGRAGSVWAASFRKPPLANNRAELRYDYDFDEPRVGHALQGSDIAYLRGRVQRG